MAATSSITPATAIAAPRAASQALAVIAPAPRRRWLRTPGLAVIGAGLVAGYLVFWPAKTHVVAVDSLTIRAPVAGTVLQLDVEAGQLIGPTAPLLILSDLADILVAADVDKAYATQVAAAAAFVRAGGRLAGIGRLNDARVIIEGRKGTRILPDHGAAHYATTAGAGPGDSPAQTNHFPSGWTTVTSSCDGRMHGTVRARLIDPTCGQPSDFAWCGPAGMAPEDFRRSGKACAARDSRAALKQATCQYRLIGNGATGNSTS